MAKARAEYRQAFAIVRVDGFQDDTVTLPNKIRVTKVVFDQITASVEVDRLNQINGGKGATYFSQATHLEGEL